MINDRKKTMVKKKDAAICGVLQKAFLKKDNLCDSQLPKSPIFFELRNNRLPLEQGNRPAGCLALERAKKRAVQLTNLEDSSLRFFDSTKKKELGQLGGLGSESRKCFPLLILNTLEFWDTFQDSSALFIAIIALRKCHDPT